jgi:PBP1b-binding outer membrane lipoprotein LpoB
MFKKIAAISLLVLLAAGCEDEDQTAAETEGEEIPVLSIPGTIQLPGADGFVEMDESASEAILLYCWLPLGEYPESQEDLVFLSTVQERSITPVPIQFSPEVRNASQTQLNSLEISMSVALGDDSVKHFLEIGSLPAAALVRPDGSVTRAYGFGCVERTLRGGR